MLAVRQVAWQSSSLVVSPKCPKTHTARQLGLKYLFQNATFTTLDSPQHKKPTQIQKKVFIKERKISRNKLGFIGAGKLAESIARGVVRSGILPPDRITTSHSSPIRRQAFESFGVHLLPHNDDVVEESDVIIFAVKPQVVKVVVLQLRPLLSRKKLLVSIAAGVKLKDLQDCAGHSRFIRVMPNTPSDVGVAASVLSLGGAATEQDGDLIAELFGSVGKIWKADEKLFDAITGLRGFGRWRSCCRSTARTCIGSSISNSSMATSSGKHPGQLKDDVTSPGGTTITGIHELEKGGFRGILMNAVVAAARRSRELSQN